MRVYRQNHKLKRDPCSIKSVRNLVKKFEETECPLDDPRSGRPSVFEVVAEVHNTMTTGSLHTARSVSRSLDVPKTTFFQILHSVLRMFCYRFQSVQALKPGHNQQRVDFASFFLNRCDEDSRWPLRILWTDETHFTNIGNLNSKNCFHWEEENPHGVASVPL